MSSPQKKILCVSVSVGAGHVRAAEAIVARARALGIEATHIDMMDHVSKAYKTAFTRSYTLLIKQAPQVWGLIYNSTNKEKKDSHWSRLSKRFSHVNTKAFLRHVQEYAPTHIIGTHYLPTQTLGNDRPDFLKEVPISLVLTDYDKHALFVSNDINQFFVATEKMQFKLIEAGLKESQIIVSGIPINTSFYEPYSAHALKKAYGYDPEVQTILVLSGGEGLIDLTKIVETLFRLPKKTTIIAVAGKNTVLAQKLNAMSPPPHIHLTALGWTDELESYMKMADIIITKPGGLTTSECIVLQKPILAIQPIPGQEEHNVEFILEHGYGVVARSLSDLLYYIGQKPEALGHGYTAPKGTKPLLPAVDTILSSLQ